MYKNILKNTFASVFEKKDILFKALLIPTLLLMLFDFFLSSNFTNLYIVIPLFILSVLVNITVSITTHRILLLEKSNIPTWGLFKLSSREYEFLFSSIGLGLILLVVLFVGAIILFVMESIVTSLGSFEIVLYAAILFLCLYVIYIVTRLSMVFPSIALNKDLTFKQSWQYTKKYKLLCFITIAVFPLLFGITFSLVYGVAIQFLMNLISAHLTVLYSILNVFINVFIISALSNTYKQVMSDIPETEESINIKGTDKIYKLSINDFDIIELEANHEITFESLKAELSAQYEQQGYVNAVVDKIDSWVVKQLEEGESYVALRATSDEYQIQTFNTDEPVLSVLEKVKISV